MALGFLLIRPEGLFGENTSIASGASGSARRGNNTCFTVKQGNSNQAMPPISRSFRSARTGSGCWCCWPLRSFVVPGRRRVLAEGDPGAVSGVFAGRGAQHPHWLCRAVVAGFRCLHGCGAFAPTTHVAHRRHAVTGGLFALGGLSAALVGIVFGLPSLRIKGFYLAVARWRHSSSLSGLLTKLSWFSNDSSSGVITAQGSEMFGCVPNA